MAEILLVEDSAMDRELTRGLLDEHSVRLADHGRAALEAVAEALPDLVLTDLMMPEMDGLDLVRELRATHPALPIILMTAHGSEEIAAEALRRGATSYVPKRHLARDLEETIDAILAVKRARAADRALHGCLARSEHHFVLDNDPAAFRPLVAFLKEQVEARELCDETGLMQLSVALDEALTNALHHGNLEVDSAIRERDVGAYFEAVEERRTRSPYRERRIHVSAVTSPEEATIVVRDEGPGFDPASLPDPAAPENLERASGRGLLLIRTFMQEVRHNDAGNQITMVYRKVSEPGS